MARTVRLSEELEQRLGEMVDGLDYGTASEFLRDTIDRQYRLYERFKQERGTDQDFRPYEFLLFLESLEPDLEGSG